MIRTTTERGLGWTHQQQTQALKDTHIDGTPCWWCGRPMFLDPDRNWDHRALSGDHTVPRADGGTITDRLLHGTCNSERGDGSRDDHRPSLTEHSAAQQLSDADLRRMDWPI